jgi:hypothetical protein
MQTRDTHRENGDAPFSVIFYDPRCDLGGPDHHAANTACVGRIILGLRKSPGRRYAQADGTDGKLKALQFGIPALC